MTIGKHRIGIAGLCLLASLVLTMFVATSAQADWKVKGADITGTTGIEGEKDKGTYGFLVPSLAIELVFNNFKLDHGLLFTKGGGFLEFLMTEGSLYSKGVLVKGCTPGDLTFKVKQSLILHNGKTYVLLQPAEGSNLTLTTYNEETCPLPPTVAVTGSLVLEDPNIGFEKEAVEHLVQQAPDALFPSLQMKFGTNPMHLDGTMILKLNGANKGLTWSAVV